MTPDDLPPGYVMFTEEVSGLAVYLQRHAILAVWTEEGHARVRLAGKSFEVQGTADQIMAVLKTSQEAEMERSQAQMHQMQARMIDMHKASEEAAAARKKAAGDLA